MTLHAVKYLMLLCMLVLTGVHSAAQEDVNDTQLRLNPNIGSDNSLTNVKVSHYPFLKYN